MGTHPSAPCAKSKGREYEGPRWRVLVWHVEGSMRESLEFQSVAEVGDGSYPGRGKSWMPEKDTMSHENSL